MELHNVYFFLFFQLQNWSRMVSKIYDSWCFIANFSFIPFSRLLSMVLIRFEIQVFDFLFFLKKCVQHFLLFFFRLNSSHLHLMVHWAGEGSPVIFVLARSQVMDQRKIFKSFDIFLTQNSKHFLTFPACF